jgi:hypothetical protein
MDINTVSRKMDAQEIDSPDDFSRLVRLIFENAITFYVDPAHLVHQAARTLLALFNQQFHEVERIILTQQASPLSWGTLRSEPLGTMAAIASELTPASILLPVTMMLLLTPSRISEMHLEGIVPQKLSLVGSPVLYDT